MFSALELGETSVISGREALGDNLSDKGAYRKLREDAPLPVHVINLVVEGSTLNPKTLKEHPSPDVARHKPFYLQPRHVSC